MSRTSITLKADGLSVRCAASKRYAVAVPAAGKLLVTKRTNDVPPLTAELRSAARRFPQRKVYLFDLVTGTLLHTRWPQDTATIDDGQVARWISDGGRS